MFWKLVREPFRRTRSRRRAVWAVLAIALGTAVAAAMLSVWLDVGDRVGHELRSLGANILISPAADSLPVEIGGIDYRPVSEGAYIPASSLPKLKEIFWRNNILAFAPFLYVPAGVRLVSGGTDYATTLVGTWFDYPVVRSETEGPALSGVEEFRTGIRSLNPTWKLEGAWIDDANPNAAGSYAVLGHSLAEKLGVRVGDNVEITMNGKSGTPEPRRQKAGQQEPVAPVVVAVKGILTTGGAEDDQVLASLAAVQSWAGLEDKARKVQVSALIKPEDALSRRNPKTMTPEEYDRWYCSPYVSSILHQINEALPGTTGRPVRQVAETQGNVLSKLTFLMGTLALLALVAAALSISSLASLTVMERRQEIGLMKALGARDGLVSGFFVTEMALQGVVGGFAGFVGGQLLARVLGRVVFDSEVNFHWLALPIILLVALGVSFAGTWGPVKRAVRQEPAQVLRGE